MEKKYQGEAFACEFLHIHEDVVDEVRRHLPPEEELFRLAELFHVFGDSTRIKILSVLLAHELCVCDIAALLQMTVSAVSHQLRILRGAALVRARKAGKAVFYTLADDHVRRILDQGLEHVTE